MNQLDPGIKRVIAAARQAAPGPLPDLPPGLATRVLSGARAASPEGLSNRLLGAILAASVALALVWLLVLLDHPPAGSYETFNQIATRMVTRVGR
jgi:hypothetical protein